VARRGGRDRYRPHRVKPTSTVGLRESLRVPVPQGPSAHSVSDPPSWSVIGALVDYTPPSWPGAAMIRGARIIAAPFRLPGHGWVTHLDKVRGWVAIEALRRAEDPRRG